MWYVFLNEDITNQLLARDPQNIQVTTTKSVQVFLSLKYPNKKQILSPNLKKLLYHLKKGEITAMDKGKGIQTESTKKEMVDIRK